MIQSMHHTAPIVHVQQVLHNFVSSEDMKQSNPDIAWYSHVQQVLQRWPHQMQMS